MITSTQFHTLLDLPAKEWEHVASDAWIELCEGLQRYEWKLLPELFPLSRKWELASALQKSIRRGDRDLALQLVAKVQSMRPQEHAYFWRRLSVIACEDVGAGDTELTLFVVACSQVFTPVQSKSILFDLFGFLVERLCAVTLRSRVACTAACVAEMLPNFGSQVSLTHADREILREMENAAKRVDMAESGFRSWQRRNGWRTAGLLKYVDLALPHSAISKSFEPTPSIALHGLPSYSYDMYTRSGRDILRRLIRGVPGAIMISTILNRKCVREALEAAGEALFFEEGGYLKDEIESPELIGLLHRFFATRFGLSDLVWKDLRSAMSQGISDGTLNALRNEELSTRYSQASLFIV